MPKFCPFCNIEYPVDAPYCLVCGRPAPTVNGYAPGYPNVIIAEKQEEKSKLTELYQNALRQARQAGTFDKILEFEQVIRREMKVVTACGFSKFRNLCERDGAVLPTFLQLLKAGIEYAGDDQLNIDRQTAEEATLPGFCEEVRFAALSIEDRGITHYGTFLIIWDSTKIRYRTSMLYANCVEWRYELGIGMDDPLPLGCRSTWDDCSLLAVVKCSRQITNEMDFSGYSNLLLRNKGPDTEYDIFIEAHIFGAVTRGSIEKVVVESWPELSTAKQMTVQDILDELVQPPLNIVVEKQGVVT